MVSCLISTIYRSRKYTDSTLNKDANARLLSSLYVKLIGLSRKNKAKTHTWPYAGKRFLLKWG